MRGCKSPEIVDIQSSVVFWCQYMHVYIPIMYKRAVQVESRNSYTSIPIFFFAPMCRGTYLDSTLGKQRSTVGIPPTGTCSNETCTGAYYFR